jgi:hypothetical protein
MAVRLPALGKGIFDPFTRQNVIARLNYGTKVTQFNTA